MKSKGGGKGKGIAFELEICRRLTKWVTGSERPEVFWRTSLSGGTGIQLRRRGVETKMDGDIMSIDEKGEFFTSKYYIECRSYKDLRFEDLLKEQGLLDDWLRVDVEKVPPGKEFFLIFKKNRSPVYALLPLSDFVKKYDKHFFIFDKKWMICLLEDLLSDSNFHRYLDVAEVQSVKEISS